ncbi:hypothetical protein QFZ80_002929 [Paenibacillus sp. V4I7]|nr:hypothetical protein [Paenibacillus sp. V4I7]
MTFTGLACGSSNSGGLLFFLVMGSSPREMQEHMEHKLRWPPREDGERWVQYKRISVEINRPSSSLLYYLIKFYKKSIPSLLL